MLIWSDHEVATCRPGFGGRPMLGDRLRLWRRKNLLVIGGVLQRRAKPAAPPARVMPSALVVKTWRDPKTDTTHPLRCVRRDRETGNIYTRPPVLEHVHPAQAETDAQAATLIAELWRYPSTIPEDDDGA